MSITAEWGKATVQRAAHVKATIDLSSALTAALPGQGDSGIEGHKGKGFCKSASKHTLPPACYPEVLSGFKTDSCLLPVMQIDSFRYSDFQNRGSKEYTVTQNKMLSSVL